MNSGFILMLGLLGIIVLIIVCLTTVECVEKIVNRNKKDEMAQRLEALSKLSLSNEEVIKLVKEITENFSCDPIAERMEVIKDDPELLNMQKEVLYKQVIYNNGKVNINVSDT